jgi:AcrR family transcriptional regulator
MAPRSTGRDARANAAWAGTPGRERARILAAVTEIVCETGSNSLTVSQIAGRAGVSTRTFNRIFSDPRTCLFEAFEDAISVAEKRARLACHTHADWLGRVRAALTALLELADEKPELARLCILHAPMGPAPLLSRCRDQTDMLVRALATDAPGDFAGGVRPWTAHSVVGIVLGAVYLRLARNRGPLAPMRSGLMAVIVLPYLGEQAAEHELEPGAC